MNARKQACRCPHKPNNTHMHHAQSSNSILGSKQLLCMPKHPASTLTKQLLQKILHSSDSAPCQLCFFTPGTKIKTQRDLRRMFKTTLFHVHSKLEHPQPFAYHMFSHFCLEHKFRIVCQKNTPPTQTYTKLSIKTQTIHMHVIRWAVKYLVYVIGVWDIILWRHKLLRMTRLPGLCHCSLCDVC